MKHRICGNQNQEVRIKSLSGRDLETMPCECYVETNGMKEKYEAVCRPRAPGSFQNHTKPSVMAPTNCVICRVAATGPCLAPPPACAATEDADDADAADAADNAVDADVR